MLDHLRRDFFHAVRHALGQVLRGWLIGLLVGGLLAETTGFFVDGDWPNHLFVHIAAVAFALVLSYAVAVTIALVEGVKGMVAAATQIEDVAKVAATTATNAGIGVIDAAVDAVDGPNRHGIR